MPLLFAPDADSTISDVIMSASGIRPTVRGYGNYQNLAEYNAGSGWGALANQPVSMFAHNYQTSGRIIVASQRRLYELSRSGFGTFTATDVSKNAADYTAMSFTSTGDEVSPAYWTYTSFSGNILASNRFVPMQVQAVAGAQFADLANAPSAGALTTFKGFVIAGNVGNYGAITGTNDMVAWSAEGDHTTWTPNLLSGAGFQQLFDVPGRIVALKRLGDAVAIYKQNAIWLMRYLGDTSSGQIFSFQLVDGEVGVNSQYDIPPPIIDCGRFHIFVGREDIYAFDGVSVVSLTTGVLRETLRMNFYDYTYARLSGTRITHDTRSSEIWFWDYGYSFNYRLKKWGALPSGESIVAAMESPVQTLDFGGPGVINDVETLVAKSDKRLYNRYTHGSAGSPTYADMSLTMGDVGSNGTATTITRVAPRFASTPDGTCTLDYSRRISLGAAATLDNDSVTYDSANYRFDMMKTAYWHRVALTLPSAVSAEIMGVEYSATDSSGKRVEFPLR